MAAEGYKVYGREADGACYHCAEDKVCAIPYKQGSGAAIPSGVIVRRSLVVFTSGEDKLQLVLRDCHA